MGKKVTLSIDTSDMEMTALHDSDVHYRLLVRDGVVYSRCVQNFDYYGVENFFTELCFVDEVDAIRVAKKINKIGSKHFA